MLANVNAPFFPMASRIPGLRRRAAMPRLTPLAVAMGSLTLSSAAWLAADAGTAHAAPRAFSGAWFAAKQGVQQQTIQTGRLPDGGIAGLAPMGRAQMQAERQRAQSIETVGRTAALIAARQAQQQQARQAALHGPSAVPDGLGQGGLQVDSDPSTAGWEGAQAQIGQRRTGDQVAVTVTQTDSKAILNWNTFNISRNTTLRFDQSKGTDAKTGVNEWVVLNRVNDPSGRPSEIAGRIQAEGGVYVINRNGIVFTGSSQVNVRNLVASSLKLSNEQFRAGINVRLGTTNGEVGWVNGGAHHGIPTFGETPAQMSNKHAIETAGDPAIADPANRQVDRFDPGAAPGAVQVQAGALLRADAGKVMLFAPKVSNAGEIHTPGGQTLMAAGENVWLEAREQGPSVRGFEAVVSAVRPWTFSYDHALNTNPPGYWGAFEKQVQTHVLPMMEQRAADVGYNVTNTGIVQADHGDITVVSREINQHGVLQASTALNNRDGSIRLRAWGQGMFGHSSSFDGNGGFNHLVAWSGGTVTLAGDSVTQVVNDWQDSTQIEISAVKDRYQPGRIEVYGKTLDVQSRALLLAPAGAIDLQAASNPIHFIDGNQRKLSVGDGSRILIGEGATVSTAGLLDMPVDMARNFVEAELRINELRDAFLQQGTWLYGRKVIVDRRVSGLFRDGPMAGVQWLSDDDKDQGKWVGTPVADVTGWVGNGLVDLAELASAGGDISIQAGGAVITRPGSVLDVSGGSIRYDGGWNRSTWLVGADGRRYSISKAPVDMTYVGIAGEYTASHGRWGVTRTFRNPLLGRAQYEAGYVEGANAGAIEIQAGGAIILEGDFKGGVQPGDRAQQQSDMAKAGTLTLGGASNDDRPWTPGRLVISHAPVLLPDGFGLDTQIGSDFLDAPEVDRPGANSGRTTWLLESGLADSGLGSFDFYVTHGFALAEGTALDLLPGASFQVGFTGPDAALGEFDIQGSIRAPGGNIALTAGSLLTLGASSVLDVGGQWINDAVSGSLTMGRAIHGGSMRLGTAQGADGRYGGMQVADGAIVNVSGGGWLSQDKGGSATATAGNAGLLALSGFDGKALQALDMRGWSGADAGQLELRFVGDVQLGGQAPAPGQDGDTPPVWLAGTLFGERGFGAITVVTAGNIVAPQEAQVDVLPLGWDMLRDGDALLGLASGQVLSERLAAHRVTDLQRADRAAGGLTLSTVSSGDIRLEQDSVIHTEVGGSVSLSTYKATGSIAPVGQADIHIGGRVLAPAGKFSANAPGNLVLADGAQLLLPGQARIFRDPKTLLARGDVLPGGTVTLETAGNLDAQAGAWIDVSGAQGVVEHWGGGRASLRQPVGVALGSDGGSVTLVASSGLIASRLDASRGIDTARDGDLSVRMSAAASEGGKGGIKSVLESYLGDPRWYGSYDLWCGNDCDNLATWELAVDFDWSVLFEEQGWGSAGEPIIISRALVGALDQGSAALKLSETAMGGVIQPPPLDSGMSESALDFIRDTVFYGGDDLRNYFQTPPRSYALTVRPSVIRAGRLGTLDVQVPSGISIELDNAHVALSGRISLDGAVRQAGSGDSLLAAAHIQLRHSVASSVSSQTRAGALTLAADRAIDVIGGNPVQIRGFERATLETGDLRFLALDAAYDANLASTLDVDGALEIVAAQVYPGTAMTARIVSGESITVRGNGAAQAPLSAGGTLTLSAPLIEQHGVLRAPFGEIVLDAGERLALGEGSLTSVSGAGLTIPYGTLSNNEYWLDPANPQGKNRAKPGDNVLAQENRYLSALPEKRVSLQAPQVDMAAGAVVDVAGGGDVYAWEHVPGPGGSHDMLTLPGMYAVLPGYHGLSPVVGSGAAGQVWLTGGGGLAEGWYTLLPARYALLPGAYAVQSTATVWQDAGDGSIRVASLRDGASIVRGVRRDGVSGAQDAQGSAWRVMSGDLVRRYSEFNEALGNTFFASDAFRLSQYRLHGQDVVTPRLARDGGAVVFKATERLTLDGRLVSQADAGGRGGLVDIAARKIAIVGAGQDASDLRADGYLIVDAASLSGFGAGSLLVGGTRSGDVRGMKVDVTASDVVLRNDAGSALTGPEIILAASDQVQFAGGSVLRAAGPAVGDAADLVMTPRQAAVWNNNNTPNNTDDDVIQTPSRDWGALVRASSGQAVQVLRENVDTAVGGRVRIGAGAVLDGIGALLVDATNTTEMAAGAQISGALLSVSSGRIGIGGGSGLVLDDAALAQLSRTQELTLRSYGSLDFHRSMDLGGLARVVLDAALLQGHGAETVRLQAAHLTLRNTTAGAAGSSAAGGKLELLADELVLGVGDKTIAGFGDVALTGIRRIVADGNGSLDAGTAALTLRSPVLQGLSGANQAVRTQGALMLAQSGDALDTAALAELGSQSLGARLTLAGQGATVSLPVLALGGSIAVDGGTGELLLTDSGRLLAGGLARQFFDVAQYVDGGQINLSSQGGRIRLAAGSLLDVAAHASGGNAGSLNIEAGQGGQVEFGGQMRAHAAAGGRGGAFTLAIDALPDFGALAQVLNETGFSQSRRFRIKRSDVTVSGATRVADFEVIADQGVITLDATADIAASAPYGGSIRLVGGKGLAMQSGAVLRAHATDSADGLGSGRIVLEAVDGDLHLAGGTLDVGGGEGGKVRLRAQRTAGNDGVRVTALEAVVLGARSAVLEGVRRHTSQDGTVASVQAQAVDQANAFAGNGGVLAGLGGNAAAYTLAAGIEISSTGDLTLGNDWNLQDSFGAGHREGTLTLRAGGNLNIDGHLSDGFDAAGRQNGAGKAAQLQQAASWDLRLVAGADLDSVDALATRALPVLAADSGSIRLGQADSSAGAGDGAGKLVRTGTGDLTVRAGRDLLLAHRESVLYTAGRKEADPTLGGGFDTGSIDAQYGVDGGHVDIAAQGSVLAQTQQGSRSEQILTEWLFRQGRIGGVDSRNPSGYYDRYKMGEGMYQQLPDGSWGYPVILSDRGQQPSWWVNHASFEQGLGALGGGNVRLSAGGDLVNLVVALPSVMRVTGGRSSADAAAAIQMRNGGVMRVDAGGTIKAGQYYVGRGAGDIHAGETAAGYRLEGMENNNRYEYDIAPVLALSDATLTLQTAGNLVLQTVIDPMLIRRSLIDAADAATGEPYRGSADMVSHTGRTALTLVSTGGDVQLLNQAQYITQQTRGTPGMGSGNNTRYVGMYPAQSRVAALDGSIALQGLLPMMAGDTTDLALLAAQNLDFLRSVGSLFQGALGVGSVLMAQSTLGNGADTASSILAPGKGLLGGDMADSFGVRNRFLTNRNNNAVIDNPDVLPQQWYDFTPSRLYAVNGSINGLDVIASESVHVRAGTDIRGFALDVRNLRSTDTTLLDAGNDILAMTANAAMRLRENEPAYDAISRIVIHGPGELLLSAGRDIQAGSMQLFSDGNRIWKHASAKLAGQSGAGGSLFDPIHALPEDGAGITLMAGMRQSASYDLFEQAYLDPASVAVMPDYLKTTLADGTVVPLYLTDAVEPRGDLDKLTRRGLVSFVQRMLGAERVADLTGGVDVALTPQQAWEQYCLLPALARQQFLRQVFVYELREAGRDQNVVDAQDQPRNGGYRRGYAAIDTLFRMQTPVARPIRYALDLPADWQSGWAGQGDIAAHRMAVRTHQGGDINVFTPGGGLQAAALGATVPDGYGLSTLASPGQINVFTLNDIVVNRSRILSFSSKANPLGSDQVLWATLGDIDAGRGKKTVRVGQSPEIEADEDGNVTVQEKLDLSGSGIGTVGEGDVDLAAPKGTINAGDAGIRVAGNVNIAALVVLNADNIQVEGEAKGIPVSVAINTGALTSASAAATAASTAAQETVQRARRESRQNLPSIITVQVLGFGNEPVPGAQAMQGRHDGDSARSAGGEVAALRLVGQGELSRAQAARLTPEERQHFGIL